MAENTVWTIRKFFSTEDNQVTPKEMKEFWESLSEQEKEFYRTADLK